MPTLTATWKLPLPRERPRAALDAGVRELISTVGTDTEGQQWGLVVRVTTAADGAAKMAPVRWVRWEATPFVEDETVTPNSWDVVERPPA